MRDRGSMPPDVLATNMKFDDDFKIAIVLSL